MPFARVYRVGVWFDFIRSSLLLPGRLSHHCIVVRGDAWPMFLPPCDTHECYGDLCDLLGLKEVKKHRAVLDLT